MAAIPQATVAIDPVAATAATCRMIAANDAAIEIKNNAKKHIEIIFMIILLQ